MRLLTEHEIGILEENGCTAEDWTAISVDEEFAPTYIKDVHFYGEVQLGVFEKSIEVSNGFLKHTGIFHATLRNVTIGDNNLIERVGCYINNYSIGDDCLITNTAIIETTEGANYGEGNLISVLNEIGEGNILLFSRLTSQVAALMISHEQDKEFTSAIRSLIYKEIGDLPDHGTIGNGVRIVNTKQITNTIISDDCEIDGAVKLSECTLRSMPSAPVYIGPGVICENSIIYNGSSILNSVKLQNCFVGEACTITNGFSADNAVVFANSYLANGEACATYCGPFTSSHHKSTLLIGTSCSFYNAGSNTNFSNHMYKMGPMHHGTLERGTKTASGSHILLPAKIGMYSVCFGKIEFHPDTRKLPFSYIISNNKENYLVPGRNLTTVGLYRDIKKWPKRDKRTSVGKLSIINFDWLSPFSVGRIMTAKRTLESLLQVSGENVQSYIYQDYNIKASSLKKGIKYYDIALRIYIGAVLKRHILSVPTSDIGKGKWSDLGGMLIPLSEELRMVDEVKSGKIASINELINQFEEAHRNYVEYRWAWSYRLICEYYGVDEVTEEIAEKAHKDYVDARRAWIAEIRKDAMKEYDLGDVDEETLNDFLRNLDKETEYEDLKYSNV